MNCIKLHYLSLTGDLTGLQHLWFLGDNFIAKSYRKHFKNAEGSFFIKQRYEFRAFCSSHFSCPTKNMINRLQNTMAATLNKYKAEPLPKYLIIVLDDDLITYLDCKSDGAALLLGRWVEWLSNEFDAMLTQ